jgi:mRNA interferase MazF
MSKKAAPGVGDVVLIRFPFSDGTQEKKRPALVLTPPDAYGDLVMVPITSNPAAPGGIAIGVTDLQGPTLHKPSWVRPDKPNSIESTRVDRVIASATPALLQRVRDQLCPLLGCR